MKTIKIIDEDTLEIKDVVIKEEDEKDTISALTLRDKTEENVVKLFKQALGCEPEEFVSKYKAFKKATEEFDAVYQPFKDNLLELHKKEDLDLPKNIIVGGAVKVTYVSPSTRSTIDSKKLKEEAPELAKKFTKVSNVRATVRLEEL